MSQQPLVSIVIPVYNQKLQHLREALDSNLAQTYESVEVIVSDNHSTNEGLDYLATVNNLRLNVIFNDAISKGIYRPPNKSITKR